MLPLSELENRIGYKFKNESLLKRAMTHRSFSSENNERLEFLGDSVLNCVIGNALFLKDKHFDEGSLSRVRSNLVKQSALAEIAERIGISEFLRVAYWRKSSSVNYCGCSRSHIWGGFHRLRLRIGANCHHSLI